MKGFEILEQIINFSLLEGTIKSYYCENELIDLVYMTYLKFENKWIEIVVTDEQTMIRVSDENVANYQEFKNEEYKYVSEKFNVIFPEFEKFIRKKLLTYKEIVSIEDENLSFGVSLYFSDNLIITIFNNDYPDDYNEIIFGKLNNPNYKEI